MKKTCVDRKFYALSSPIKTPLSFFSCIIRGFLLNISCFYVI